MARPRYARPVVTRSEIVLEMGEYLAAHGEWPLQQAKVIMRPQGGEGGTVTLFGCDSHEVIELVARGEVQLAIVNPSAALAMAARGAGPFKQPVDVRALAVIPSLDSYVFTVSDKTGLTSLADVAAKKYPLKVSLRGQRDHPVHLLESVVLAEYGCSFENITAWGGEVRFDPGLPMGGSTSGVDPEVARIDLLRNGTVDALFDEAIGSWLDTALAAGFHVLPIEEDMMRKFETMGFRRSMLRKENFPHLSADTQTFDFSGWPIYTHSSVPDETVRWFCEALEARKDRMPWQGEGPLPLERMCKDSPAGPLDVPLHPAAERFWRERGYL
ncbi:MAG TPA: hypothetical protein VGK54_05260 [Chloroflexota bacterium]